jgi:hypothetical protein
MPKRTTKTETGTTTTKRAPRTARTPRRPRAAKVAPAAAPAAVTHEDIALRAYEIHRAGMGGDPVEHWLRAERELVGS